MAPLEKAGRIAFGQFEVDLLSGEVWKAGFRVRLQEQPFKVLVALLARPGQVVTRSELQASVWGPDTNVDFERSLAVAVKKVREALGDSAENPRFVETLAKRGYRFIAPVTVSIPLLPLSPAEEKYGAELSFENQRTAVSAATSTPIPSQSSLYLGVPASSLTEAAIPAKKLWSRRELALAFAVLLLLGSTLALLLKAHPVQTPVRIGQITRNSLISSGTPNMESLLTLVADGDRILTSMLVDGKPQLASLDLSTSEVKPLTIPGELVSATLCDISRDGTHLLLRGHLTAESEQPLWVVPTAGGSAMRIGSVLAQAATWMPDGTSILVASGNELNIVQSDTGIMTPYLKLPGRAFWLRWSPDGKLLRFTLMDPSTHTSSIWEVASGSRTTRPLLPHKAERSFECCGTWAVDGRAYVFQASNNFSSDLWELDGDSTRATPFQLTNGPLHYSSPVAARSGREIFFYGADPPFGLQQYEGSAGGFRPAPAFLAEANRVTYSRDRKWIAWTDPVGKLWRARASDGSDRIQLTPSYLDVFLAQWAPDGSRLAIMARGPGEAWQIYLVNQDGGSPRKLFKDARNAADPSWSVDGQNLVYGREPDMMGKDGESHTIAVFNLGNQKTEVLPFSQGFFSPRWSPDGRWIAALTLNQQQVMLFDVARQSWTALAATSAADPVWSSDSRAIYVHAFMADRQPILRIAVPNGQMQVIASTADFHAGEPANYFFGGLTPDNTPLVQQRVGTGNLYRLDLNTQ